jgi:small subunit ribosomal protein S1
MSEETNVQDNVVEQVKETVEITPEAVESAPEAQNEATEAVESAQAETIDMNNVVMVKKGDTVKGKIVKIEDNQAYVDIGYKYDGIIPLRELSAINIDNAADAVTVGQEVECRVSSINDAKETLLLSKRAVDGVKAWDQLQELLDKGEVFEGVVADVVKGGLVVDVGVRGFIPASMVERHFVEDFSDYKGRTLRLKVKELDRENNKVILSQKDVLDAEFELGKQKRMAELTVGEIIEGKVQRLTNFGVFVDLGGVDGLVHVSEIAWSHVDKPEDAVKEGEAVTVKVLKLDPQNDRISLSIKQAQPGPWELVDKNFAVGAIVEGTVKRIASFGAFVEIAAGIEGLVHISQIAHRHIGTPHEVLKEGQSVNVKILEINPGEKRVSLSIKETEEAPPEQERPERSDRRREPKETVIPEAYSGEGLSITLGERFGDKLSKFK